MPAALATNHPSAGNSVASISGEKWGFCSPSKLAPQDQQMSKSSSTSFLQCSQIQTTRPLPVHSQFKTNAKGTLLIFLSPGLAFKTSLVANTSRAVNSKPASLKLRS